MLDDPRTGFAPEAPSRRFGQAKTSVQSQSARLAAEAAFAPLPQALQPAALPVVVRRKRRLVDPVQACAAAQSAADGTDGTQGTQGSLSAASPRVFRLPAPGAARPEATPPEPARAPRSEPGPGPGPVPRPCGPRRPQVRRSTADQRPGPVVRQVFAVAPAAQPPQPGPRPQELRDRLAAIGLILDDARRAAAFGLEDAALQAQWRRWTAAAEGLLQSLQASRASQASQASRASQASQASRVPPRLPGRAPPFPGRPTTRR